MTEEEHLLSFRAPAPAGVRLEKQLPIPIAAVAAFFDPDRRMRRLAPLFATGQTIAYASVKLRAGDQQSEDVRIPTTTKRRSAWRRRRRRSEARFRRWHLSRTGMANTRQKQLTSGKEEKCTIMMNGGLQVL